MLKITNNKNETLVKLTLEGKLAGEWVNELLACWRQAITGDGSTTLYVDLAGVTWVSEEGRALLREMHRNGAEMRAGNLLMSGILEEIRAENGK